MTPSAVSELLGIYAGNEVGAQQAIATARAAEIGKLGSTAAAQVDSVVNWLTGMDTSADKGDAAAIASMLVTARQVQAFQRIITRLTNQGTASFSQQHRVAPDANDIAGYDKMSFEQKRQAQDRNAASRRTA